MKGILLCGGDGTRLRPLTLAVNKHLLRIGKYPMLEYPLRKLVDAGIMQIHVVTGGENYPGVVKYLGSGSKWNVNISYSIQDRAGGIAEALSLAEAFAGRSNVTVILGDNLFTMSLKEEVRTFDSHTIKYIPHSSQATLFAMESDTPERFGVLKFDKTGTLQTVVEKPKDPPSNKVLTGIYIYTPDVFEIIRTLEPSSRGELEITDVNRHYIYKQKAKVVDMNGDWTDCGTFETLMEADRIAGGMPNE